METIDGGKVDWKSKRLRIEHGEGVMDDLIPRARALGIIVVQNPSHFTFVELFKQRWHSPMGPLRSLIEADIPVALGSDGPMNPFLNIMFAIPIRPIRPKRSRANRRCVHTPHGSAFAEFAEADKGTHRRRQARRHRGAVAGPVQRAGAGVCRRRTACLTIVGGKVVYEEH